VAQNQNVLVFATYTAMWELHQLLTQQPSRNAA